MKDIIKSGLLALALVGALVLASMNKGGESSDTDYDISKVERVSNLDKNHTTEKDRLTSKKDISTPL